jgi:hypothetical protein
LNLYPVRGTRPAHGGDILWTDSAPKAYSLAISRLSDDYAMVSKAAIDCRRQETTRLMFERTKL